MNLTKDTLYSVFRYLHYPDLLNCQLVCKLWHKTIEDYPSLLTLIPIDYTEFDRYPWDSIGDCVEFNNENFKWVLNETPVLSSNELFNLITLKSDGYPSLKINEDMIEEVYFYHNGENDEEPWYILGKLTNNMYFYMDASCDYTGFDCQGSIDFYFSTCVKSMILFGMINRSRELLLLSQK